MPIESKTTRPMNVTSIDLLPEPLKKVRGQASKLLASMLASMFDHTDDALFELADKAVNNADQTLYFDSMREVRIKREAMETRFASALQENFKQFSHSVAQQSVQPSNTGLDEGSLSLVQDDELEENVAIRGMISKVNNLCGESLQQLTQRMDSLINSSTVTQENNPLGPQRLSAALQQSCLELELDIRAKLVVYKLFERFVLSELALLYDWSNQFLIDAGVLPQIKSPSSAKIPARAGAPAAKSARSSAAEPGGGIGVAEQQDDVFSLLRGLLENSKPPQPGAQQAHLPVVESGPMLSQSDLLEMLSTVQQQSQSAANVANLEPQRFDVRRVLHALVDRDNSKVQAVGRVDDDSINLVTMLFEFILDDHNLPIPMKALLARLQIPMLKVALLDKTFFSRGAHPARKLLNELAGAAMSWNEPAVLERDALFNKVKAIVDTVLDEFDVNVEIFSVLLEDFTGFVGQERRKADLIEQRTRDAEEGLGKTQRARAEVGKLINDRAAGKTLPNVVVELLREGWANYLFLLYVKEGAECDAWSDAVQVLDDLIWSVDRDASFGHRSVLLKMIPSLLQRLREGLNSISFSKTQMRELFTALEHVHMDCLRSEEEEPGVAAHASETAAERAEQTAVRQLAETVAADKVSPVIVAAPELEPLDEQATDLFDSDDKLVALVDSLAVGAWMELRNEQGEKSRCKLAAIIRVSGKYIFVNRVGIKVVEYTRSTLIEAARNGVIRVLDNALLFDRALESVIGHLREMKD